MTTSPPAPPAPPANPWKEAVIDELAEACMDAPLTESPSSILKRVIAWHIQVATDPAVNGGLSLQPVAAPPARLPGKESRHMDDSELYCPQCNGSGEGREMTTGHGPDDYEYDCPCQLCGGNGSLFRAFEGMKAERDALRQKYNAALARFPVPSLPRAEVEQRTYKDGTQATGTAPLPDKSPAEQERAALSSPPTLEAAPADAALKEFESARDHHNSVTSRANYTIQEYRAANERLEKARAALSAQASPEYRTGFDEAPSTFNQEDAATADYPPTDAAQAEFTDYFVRNYPGPDTIITDPKWHAPKLFRAAQRAISRAGLRSGVSADPLPLTHTYVQPVPDKCDRITWRGHYYHLPVSPQSQPLVEPTARRLTPEEVQDACCLIMLGDFDKGGDYDNAIAQAVTDRVFDVNGINQHQVKKGELSWPYESS